MNWAKTLTRNRGENKETIKICQINLIRPMIVEVGYVFRGTQRDVTESTKRETFYFL